ncbi:uncharacterized protein LOC115760035 [Drosophila novamexicana]|uniref:uncharacterized protein LOC115760035 n=1 Tax=Drosophila novamexicana TaxID=47314 RepID=UPI0011E5B06B|nr:uncharacterized protein LOC115760035 [Drosophila novamexicana]
MDYLDLDSFRSRYSDITVTAVPAKRQKTDGQDEPPEVWEAAGSSEKTPAARVEIIPITLPNGAAPTEQCSKPMQQQQQHQQKQQQQQFTQDAVAYSNEYQQVLAKLEYTKYVQAQLQLMSSNNALGACAFGELLYGLPGSNMQLPSAESNGTTNIVDTYDNLLAVIGEMQSNLGPTAIGLRAPKERLLRDIAHARVLVRECILMLMRDHQQQQQSCEE